MKKIFALAMSLGLSLPLHAGVKKAGVRASEPASAMKASTAPSATVAALAKKNSVCRDLEAPMAELKKLNVQYKDDQPKAVEVIKKSLDIFDDLYDLSLRKGDERRTLKCVAEFALTSAPFDEGSVISDTLYSHYKEHQRAYDSVFTSLARSEMKENKEKLFKDFAAYDRELLEEKLDRESTGPEEETSARH